MAHKFVRNVSFYVRLLNETQINHVLFVIKVNQPDKSILNMLISKLILFQVINYSTCVSNMSSDSQQNRVARWYFGGLASSGAACITHPLDLLKVTLQTQQDTKRTALQITGKIIRERGIFAFYNGLSASLLRQGTYSTTRFGLYEAYKQEYGTTFLGKVLLAGASGAAGGNSLFNLLLDNYLYICISISIYIQLP